jgi:tetratricopeptide (TPR) repeat protein
MPMQSVELSMIVKDGAATLHRCLASVRHAVDRIVIGDTGSTDETLAIAHEFRADVFSIPWQGDFSSARNSVLAQGYCDWVLVLDADEMLDPGGAATLAQMVQQPGPDAYDVWRWNYVFETNCRSGEHGAILNPGLLQESMKYPAYVRSLNTRLFRRHPEIYFERPVHETIAQRLQVLQFQAATAPFVIHHFGQVEDPEEKRKQKNELYQHIGLEHLQQNPKDARTCFELGLGELEHFKNTGAALSFFLRAVNLDHRDSNSLTFAGVCLVRLKRYAEAAEILSDAAEIDPRSIVLHETLGDAFFHQGQYENALGAYRDALHRGSGSALVMAKQGVCQIYIGQKESGIRDLREAINREPDFPELIDIAVAGAVLAQENEFAAAIARRRLAMPDVSAFHYEFTCSLLRLSGDRQAYCQIVRDGLTMFPNSAALLAESNALNT